MNRIRLHPHSECFRRAGSADTPETIAREKHEKKVAPQVERIEERMKKLREAYLSAINECTSQLEALKFKEPQRRSQQDEQGHGGRLRRSDD